MSIYFGEVKWTDEDIAMAFGYDFSECTEAEVADIASVRRACNAGVYGIRDAMTEAGWNFIHNAVADRIRKKEAIDRHAREEEHPDTRHQ